MDIQKEATGSIVSYQTYHPSGARGSSSFSLSDLQNINHQKASHGFVPLELCAPVPGIDPSKNYRAAVISSFHPNGADTSLHRMGNGSKLLEIMEKDARENGAEVMVFTHACNSAIKKFLEKNGFVESWGKYLKIIKSTD